MGYRSRRSHDSVPDDTESGSGSTASVQVGRLNRIEVRRVRRCETGDHGSGRTRTCLKISFGEQLLIGQDNSISRHFQKGGENPGGRDAFP
jgi:hypothetical protein